MEITVSFTDKTCEEMEASGYQCDESELGKVYYPAEGIEITDTITVRYERYPWIECFEVDGIDIPKNEKINPMELNSLNNEFSFDFSGDILEAVSEET